MEPAEALLQAAVDADGNVDYNEALGGRALDEALEVIAHGKLANMDDLDEYAFLINAYNVATLDCVRRRLWGKGRWRTLRNPLVWLWFFFFTPITVAGRRMSLWALEFRQIKPFLRRDPRGHFALVCASTGCPPLRGGVFHGTGLEGELEAAGRVFCQPGGAYELDREKGQLKLNRIFKWYAKDFAKSGGSLAVWANYAPAEDVDWVLEHGPKLRFMRYDWGLNQSQLH